MAVFPLGDELVLYKFENDGSTVVNSGTGSTTYDSAFTGNATYTANPYNGSYSGVFDGAGDAVDSKFGNGRNPASAPFTISCWAYRTGAGSGGDQHLFGVSASPAATRCYVRYRQTVGKWGLRVAGNASVESAIDVTLNTWYHVCLVMDGTTATLYINGASAGTSAYTSYTLPGNIYCGNEWLNGVADAVDGWAGRVDDFAIYNRALSGPEVADIAKSKLGNSAVTTVCSITATPDSDVGGTQEGTAILSCTSTLTPTARVTHAAISWANRLGVLANTAVRNEISGICRSNIDTNLFWGLNDSGGAATIYAIGAHGEDRGAWALSGLTNTDWEDISNANIGGTNYLYVGDIGDNGSIYATHKIHRIVEPVLSNNTGGTVSSGNIESITYQYPESPQGESYNNGSGVAARRDAESLAVDPLTGDMYVFSKRETQPRIFKLAHAASYTGTQTLTYVGTMQGVLNSTTGFQPSIVGNAVGADFSPNGLEFLIRTHESVYYLKRTSSAVPIATWLLNAPMKVDSAGIGNQSSQNEPQGESVCFDHAGTGYVTLSETYNNSLVYFYHFSLGCMITANGGIARYGSAALASVATLTSTGTNNKIAASSMAVVSTITATGKMTYYVVSSMSVVAAITAAGTVEEDEEEPGVTGTANLSVINSCSAAANVTHNAVAVLSCGTSLEAEVEPTEVTLVQIPLNSEGCYDVPVVGQPFQGKCGLVCRNNTTVKRIFWTEIKGAYVPAITINYLCQRNFY